jgi:hypothetical protein
MPLARTICAALAVAAIGGEAAAGQAVSIERHLTTNALDGPVRIRDWYTALRGSLEREIDLGETDLIVAVAGEAKRFDTIDIENDSAASLKAVLRRSFGPGVRASAGFGLAALDEGDDIAIGPFVIGTRARRWTPAAEASLGIDLDAATTLDTSVVGSWERPGRTRFQDAVIQPLQLDAERRLLDTSVRLSRRAQGLAAALMLAARLTDAEETDTLPAIRSQRVTLQAEAAYQAADALKLEGAAGLQSLDGGDLYRSVRPVWQIGVTWAPVTDVELRGKAYGRYELDDTDDPLGSWMQRVEAEAGKRFGPAFAIGAGFYLEARDNLTLGYRENHRGIYGEGRLAMSKAGEMVVRLDWSRVSKPSVGGSYEGLDGLVRLSRAF